ncbi:GNAT family N-acetyltransferase [Paenibacillus sp. NPDC057934]|uniref:GNAT family N-acetyltransferase n=1 Tax=Paenibacillus sp. NPDC057934 TaxID=3346282 RepID=UPI0036DA2625
MLALERAIKNDAQELTEIQKASFNEELKQFNNNEISGPIGYDSISWQEEMIQNSEYFKVLLNGEIIGGAIILIESNHVHNLGRVFIDPSVQNQGIGMKVMKEIEKEFPDSTKWWLDTPVWCVKNHHFYTRCGFTKVRLEDDLFIFEKMV